MDDNKNEYDDQKSMEIYIGKENFYEAFCEVKHELIDFLIETMERADSISRKPQPPAPDRKACARAIIVNYFCAYVFLRGSDDLYAPMPFEYFLFGEKLLGENIFKEAHEMWVKRYSEIRKDKENAPIH